VDRLEELEKSGAYEPATYWYLGGLLDSKYLGKDVNTIQDIDCCMLAELPENRNN
jgi:hypothetical protein